MKKINVHSNKFRRIMSISVLIVGALIISTIIAITQTNSSKERQRINGVNALEEISLKLEKNNETIENITFEYDKLNQNTTESLSNFANKSDLFRPIIEETDPTTRAQLISKSCTDLAGLQEDLKLGTIGVVDTEGNILICSKEEYINTNLVDYNVSSSSFGTLFRYSEKDQVNGTEQIVDKNYIYSPISVVVEVDGEKEDFYMYSSHLDDYDGKHYFIVSNVSNKLLETELSGIDKIGNVLSSLSLGETGFFFAIDTSTGKFVYFDHNGSTLTDSNYQEHGYKEEATLDGYSGYQKIDGVRYYCVTKECGTATYGDYIIVCAAIDQNSLINKNIITIFVSCITFILVACIVSGQGMILDREIANHFILVENRVKEKIRDDKIEGVGSYTEEEIKERVHIQMEEIVEKKEDNELKRVNIGFRDRRGIQRYFLPYVFNNMLPVFIIGIVAIFGIVFFSQSIMSVQDATTTAHTKLNEIGNLIEENNDNTEKISYFVSEQYLSKSKLLGYVLTNENPDDELKGPFDLDIHDKDTFQLYEMDENGKKVLLTDEFGNPRLSRRNAPVLEDMCVNNDLNSIRIFDYEGNSILTSEDDWLFSLSKTEGDQSYEFREIIDGKVDFYKQPYGLDENGKYNQYIASVFYYYTYNDEVNHMTRHVSKSAYEKYIYENDNTYGKIIEHRGAIQISINHETLESVYRIATLKYLLEGTSIYGSNSFFLVFDNTEEHNVIFAPKNHIGLLGQTASDLHVSKEAFSYNSIYNGFIKISGQDYYQSFMFVDDCFLVSVIPMNDISYNRMNISLFTFALSAIFILIGSSFFTVSNNKADEQHRDKIRSEGKAIAKPIGFTVTGVNGKKKKTMSAYSRYFRVGWNKKTPEQKLSSILMIYLTIASFIVLGIIVFALSTGTSDSIFSYIFSNRWDKGFNLFSITEAIMIILIIITVCRILKFVVKWFSTSLGARAETTGNLIVSVLKYGGVLGSLFYALYLFGFDTGGILTSAGILSVVIGLGAQSLIGDILAGMFIVFESEFRVGDIVTIGDFRGQVIEIGLRTTKLVDISNNVKVFNNSVISSVLNMTKESSYAVVDVSIEYGADLHKVEQVLLEGFPKIRKDLPTIIEGPFYRGVESLGDSAVIIRIVANCEEKDRIQLARDLNREVFLLFKEHGINIPFNQLTLSYLEEGEKHDEKDSNND